MDLFRLFRIPSRYAREFFCYTDGLGHQTGQDFLIDREEFINNLLMHVVSGIMHVEQNGHHIVQPGQTVIMRLSRKHKYYADPASGCDFCWMHFGGKSADLLMRFYESLGDLPLILPLTGIPEAVAECHQLLGLYDLHSEIAASRLILDVLEQAAGQLVSLRSDRVLDEQTRFISQVTQYIDNHLGDPVSLDNLADLFNLSRFHFCRVFRQYTGTTPAVFVLEYKIQRAKVLLTWTNDSIAAIAMALGFADQSHFSRTFRQYTQATPSNYRKFRTHG